MSGEIFRRTVRDCIESGSVSEIIDPTIIRNSWCNLSLLCEFFNRADN